MSPKKSKDEVKQAVETLVGQQPRDAITMIIQQMKDALPFINFSRGITGEITEFIPTGITHLDAVLGGGFPSGRIVEIFGPESSGKTTLALSVAGSAIKQNGMAIILDSEHTIDPTRLKELGIDDSRLLYVPCDTLEDGFDTIIGVLDVMEVKDKREYPAVIIWDTIASATTRGELEKTRKEIAAGYKKRRKASESVSEEDEESPAVEITSSEGMGYRARRIKEGLRQVVGKLADKKAVLILVNHTMANLARYGEKEDTPGGKGLKFNASLRIRLQSAQPVQEGMKEKGTFVRIYIKKSKICKPKQDVEVYLNFERGFDSDSSLLDSLLGKWENGDPIEKRTIYYYVNYNPENKGDFNGIAAQAANFGEVLSKHPGLRVYLETECYKKYAPLWYKQFIEELGNHKANGTSCLVLPCIDCPEVNTCLERRKMKRKLGLNYKA